MTTDRTPKRMLAEVLLGEDIEQWVAARRSKGCSWRLLARELYEATDQQVDVTYETLRTWCDDEPAGRRSA